MNFLGMLDWDQTLLPVHSAISKAEQKQKCLRHFCFFSAFDGLRSEDCQWKTSEQCVLLSAEDNLFVKYFCFVCTKVQTSTLLVCKVL